MSSQIPLNRTSPNGFAETRRISESVLKPRYDFIVCGSGSSGSVVARRLAENPEVSVLLLEAGGDDDVPSVTEANQWPLNLGSERDWSFHGQPNPHVNGRSIPFSMGKVLGGGSSINVMVWARGHKADWDLFAAEAGDPHWNYESILNIYRRIEDWQGAPDPMYRGTGGPVFVQPAPHPNPLAPATVEAAQSAGLPDFRECERPHDGSGKRRFHHGCARPQRQARINFPFLRLSDHGPAEPDGS